MLFDNGDIICGDALEYPWIEEDDDWDEEPEDTEVMKDDREDEWE